jgi:DUF3097, C-terminal domain
VGDPGDILSPSRAPADPRLPATPGLDVLHRPTGLRGRIHKFTGEIVVIRDARGREHQFRNGRGVFAHRGETVELVAPARPAQSAPAVRRSAAGAVVADGAPARVARASRLWVEGDHDARLLERVWGDDLRELGIVVEALGGIDDLAARVATFEPGPTRRVAILVDHLVEGSKESRIAASVVGPDVVVVGHPHVDVWQCVRPRSVGIDAWPEVPRGEDWKSGVCRRLGWAGPVDGWRRVLASVDSFADLDPGLVGAVERALDSLADAP